MSDKSQSARDSLTVSPQLHYQDVLTLSSNFHFVSGYLHFTTHPLSIPKSTTLVP